jgi:peptide subunit release factor 1 (eRF1)
VSSKVGSRQVHGRSAAGGQSQQRFARRREGQARVALAAAADNAARILLPELARLDAVVVGGDRAAVDEVMTDRRLHPLLPLLTGRLLDVPDPRLKVLQTTPDLFRAVRIRLVEPVPVTPP